MQHVSTQAAQQGAGADEEDRKMWAIYDVQVTDTLLALVYVSLTWTGVLFAGTDW